MFRTIAVAGMLVATPAAAQDSYQPDETVRDAFSLQVTDRGLDAVSVLAADLVPGLLGDGLLALDDIDVTIDLFGSTIGVQLLGPVPGFTVTDIIITPVDGGPFVGAQLNATIDALFNLNTPDNPYDIGLFLFAELCGGDGLINPTRVTIDMVIELTVVTDAMGNKSFDVTIELPSNAVNLGNWRVEGECSGVTNIALEALGQVLVDIILGPIIEPLIAEFEPQIEDALGAAVFDDSFDVLDTTLFIELEPQQVLTTADGLELLYSSKFTAAQAACVVDIDPLGSLKTDTEVPLISSNSPQTQIAAYLSDDMLNQLFYAVFSGGLLCLDIDDELVGDSSPLPIDASLIPLVGGTGFNAILPSVPGALLIRTRPQRVPTVTYADDPPITLNLNEFGLDFYTDLEHRQARIFGVNMDAAIGAGINFDATTGMLGVAIDAAAEDFLITLDGDELVPGARQSVVDGFGNILDLLLGTLLDSLLGDVGFALPAFGEVGLAGLDTFVTGDLDDWLGVDAFIGPVEYGDPEGGVGCDEEGGCAGGGCGADGGCAGGGCDSGSSCGGGCNSVGLNLGTYLLVFLPLWVLRRRRD